LLLLLAVGLFKLIGKDVGDAFDDLLRWVKIDPGHRFFARIGEQLDKVTPTISDGLLPAACFTPCCCSSKAAA